MANVEVKPIRSDTEYTMCKIANFEGQMGGHNLNKIDGFLVSRDYI